MHALLKWHVSEVCLQKLCQALTPHPLLQNIVAKTKRLRLMVREDGIIVGASADKAWALNALGVDPTKIIHQSMAQYIDIFTDFSRSLPTGRLTPTLVTGEKQSMHRASDHVHEQCS